MKINFFTKIALSMVVFLVLVSAINYFTIKGELVGLTNGLVGAVEEKIKNEFLSSSTKITKDVAIKVESLVKSGEFAALKKYVLDFKAKNESVFRVYVFDKNLRIYADSDSSHGVIVSDLMDIQTQSRREALFAFTTIDKKIFLKATQPLYKPNSMWGMLSILFDANTISDANEKQLSYTLSALDVLKGGFLIKVVFINAIFALIFILLVMLLINPTRKLMAVFENLKSYDLRKLEATELPRSYTNIKSELIDVFKKLENLEDELAFLRFDGDKKIEERTKELHGIHSQVALKSKMESLKYLVAGVCHSLNNPLQFIHGNIDIIQKGLSTVKQDDSKKEFEQAIDSITSGLTRMKEIVENLKLFSKIDEASQKEVNINEIINSSLGIMEPFLGKTKVDKKNSEIPAIMGDGKELGQLFMNIFKNSIEAINASANKDKGKIVVESLKMGNDIVVTVSDNGKGVEKNDLKKVFDPFFSTKKESFGAGLGLAVAHGIVEKHNGQISLENNKDLGAKLTIKFPVGK